MHQSSVLFLLAKDMTGIQSSSTSDMLCEVTHLQHPAASRRTKSDLVQTMKVLRCSFNKKTNSSGKQNSLANQRELMLRRHAKMPSSEKHKRKTIGYLLQQTHASFTSLPSLCNLPCSDKMSTCLRCGLLSQECQCE